MKNHIRRHQLAAALSVIFAPALALGATKVVTNCADAGSGSLRDAIANAASGDVITFNGAAVACGTINLTSGALQVDAKHLTIQGSAASPIAIDAGSSSQVIISEDFGEISDHARTLMLVNLILAHGKLAFSSSNGATEGGCIATDGDLALVNSTVTGCSNSNDQGSAAGGGVVAYTLHMKNSAITHSGAYATIPSGSTGARFANGGAALILGPQVVLDSSTITDNIATVSGTPPAGVSILTFGGGIAQQSTAENISLQVSASTISRNTADTGAGGGFFVLGSDPGQYVTLTISGSTIANNAAKDYAGGTAIGYLNAATVSNTTITGNVATDRIGGLYVIGATLTNDTIVGNTATAQSLTTSFGTFSQAAGLSLNTGTLINTIVANNTLSTTHAPSDFSSYTGTVKGSNDLITSVVGTVTLPADTLTVDPMLAPLGNNGGPTQTMAPKAGSPVIDAGTTCATALPSTDQRGAGYPRLWGASPDIGAYEYGDPASGDVIFHGAFEGQACAT